MTDPPCSKNSPKLAARKVSKLQTVQGLLLMSVRLPILSMNLLRVVTKTMMRAMCLQKITLKFFEPSVLKLAPKTKIS